MIKDQIQQLSKNIFNDVVANRRHLHSHPELSFHEVETSAFVAGKLDALGLRYQRMADNGLVALIREVKNRLIKYGRAARGHGCAAHYAKLTTFPYKSQNEGVMHACGAMMCIPHHC